MKNRSVYLCCFLLSGLLLTAQVVCAQQPADEGSRNEPEEVKCRRTVTILGAVRTPVRVELRRRTRLVELLAIAGGLTERAGGTITVTRIEWGANCDRLRTEVPNEKQASVVVYDLKELLRGNEKHNPFVNPGDVVTVFESEKIYVVGNVKNPGAIKLKRAMTVTQAIALAGGVLSVSRTDRVMIIRRKSGDLPPTSIFVDLKAIEEHRAEDVILRPSDIIDVPSKKQRRDLFSPPIYDAPAPKQVPSRANVLSS